MPSASIQSLVNSINLLVGVSRDDVVVGDVVTVSSANVHTTYSWTLTYRPAGSAAAFSGVVTNPSPGNFTVDVEGAYMVRLTADLGLATESTQYVRIRYLTVLGALTLVAAGEGYGGAIPVPVDQTATGWTDALNGNLMTLLGLVGLVSTSGRVLTVDPTPGYGDHQTLQAAIDAGVAAGASGTSPYVVLVRPGQYVEDVTFKPFVHVLGWPGNPVGGVGVPVVYVRGAHTIAMPGGADSVLLSNLTLANIVASVNAAVTKTGPGSATLYRCDVEQNGLNAAQGPALMVSAGTVLVDGCNVLATSALPNDRAAITQPGASASTLTVRRSQVTGPTGLVLNSTFGPTITTTLSDTAVLATGATGTGITSDAGVLDLRFVQVSTTSNVPLTVHPGAAAFATGQSVTVEHSLLDGPVAFDTTGIVGATAFRIGSSTYDSLSFPGGNPGTLAATTKSTSVFYDNTTTGILATNVQDAIDEVHAAAILVRTLDDAYNGGIPLSGSGRTIYASAGSVQILDAVFPSDPPPAGNTNARLEVVSAVRVGSVGFPEIDADPNPYGSGPAIVMGNRVVPGNIPWGAGTAMVMGRSTGNPLFRNYNLRVQTQSSVGGGAIGRLILQGGDALDNGGATPDAASVYVQAGSALNVAGLPGNVFVVPGRQAGGTPGSIVLATLEGATPATLTALGACADPIGVAGTINFATNMGAVSLTVAAVDTRAAVVAALSALEGISAAEAAGIITITTDALGPNAEVYFLSATAGLDAAIGGFDGVAQVDGTYARTIEVQVSLDQEVSFGVNGAVGPMIYNADTGKLTVPGLIDPTAVVFEEAAAPATGATEGAVFVSDGTGGLVVGNLYYRAPANAVPLDLSAGALVPALSAVLAAGNTTGGTDLVISAADALDASAGELLLPLAAAPAQTANGSMVWDSNDFLLTVGDGVGRKTMVDTSSTQTLSNKTLSSPTFLLDDANNNSVQDVVKVAHTTSGMAAPIIGAGILFQLENSAGGLVDAARVAGFLEDVTPGLEISDLGFYTKPSGGAVQLRWVIDGDGAFTPVTDNVTDVGDNSNRIRTISAISFLSINAPGDVNPTYRMTSAGFAGGIGGGSAPDAFLARIAGPLWSMNVGLRVSGNVTRNEGTITFGTTRTNAGAGDNVTVQPSNAVAGAGSAQPGGQGSLFGSNAAATGPGNFSALGGQVVVQAGNSAAVNVAQANGPDVTITGGNAASGAGGGPAQGGGVSLVGAAGAGAGGDGGRVSIRPGPGNGGGPDGVITLAINGAARTPNVQPQGDNQGLFGANNLRWSTFNGVTYNSYNAGGDANPIYRMDNTGFAGGPGAAGVLDVTLTRIFSGTALWNMNLGLRVGGNVTRNEGNITFGTTRTNNGGGADTVTVQPALAVAGAGSAQPGSQLSLFGSNAAATGPGNFSAPGGQVVIQAGNSAAVNVAQMDGPSVVVQGGNASSGAGGGPAKGGGVFVVGVAGAAGGDGGDVNVQPGQLNGGGKDGAVVFTINGAARTPNLLPRATTEGNVGTSTTRWAGVAFRDENSSGSKVVGLVSKVFGDSAYAVASSDYVILYDPTGGNSTVNLPAAASSSGRVLIIKHSSASGNTVTVDGNGGDLIDGNLTVVLASFQSLTIICNGVAWFIL